MRKGKWYEGLTDGQYRQVNKLLRAENSRLRSKLDKLQHDYDSLKTAHNKLLKKDMEETMPNITKQLREADQLFGVINRFNRNTY